MRNLFFAAFAALSLAACSATGPSAIQTVVDAKCENGISVSEVLNAQQQQYPELNIHIENVVTGEKVVAELKGQVSGDTITILGATKDGKASTAVLLIVSDKGCVTGQKFDNREDVVARGLLEAK